MPKPKITATKDLAKTRIFHVEGVDLIFSNGEQRSYERLRHRGEGAVLIIPMLNDDTMLLIREYSAGVDRYELGFPKGLIESKEAILKSANRELMEEVGHQAETLTLLRKLSTSPGYHSSQIQVVLAEGLTPKVLPGDEPEPLEVVEWRLSDYQQLLAQPDFTDARSIAALFLLLERRKQHG